MRQHLDLGYAWSRHRRHDVPAQDDTGADMGPGVGTELLQGERAVHGTCQLLGERRSGTARAEERHRCEESGHAHAPTVLRHPRRRKGELALC